MSDETTVALGASLNPGDMFRRGRGPHVLVPTSRDWLYFRFLGRLTVDGECYLLVQNSEQKPDLLTLRPGPQHTDELVANMGKLPEVKFIK